MAQRQLGGARLEPGRRFHHAQRRGRCGLRIAETALSKPLRRMSSRQLDMVMLLGIGPHAPDAVVGGEMDDAREIVIADERAHHRVRAEPHG